MLSAVLTQAGERRFLRVLLLPGVGHGRHEVVAGRVGLRHGRKGRGGGSRSGGGRGAPGVGQGVVAGASERAALGDGRVVGIVVCCRISGGVVDISLVASASAGGIVACGLGLGRGLGRGRRLGCGAGCGLLGDCGRCHGWCRRHAFLPGGGLGGRLDGGFVPGFAGGLVAGFGGRAGRCDACGLRNLGSRSVRGASGLLRRILCFRCGVLGRAPGLVRRRLPGGGVVH